MSTNNSAVFRNAANKANECISTYVVNSDPIQEECLRLTRLYGGYTFVRRLKVNGKEEIQPWEVLYFYQKEGQILCKANSLDWQRRGRFITASLTNEEMISYLPSFPKPVVSVAANGYYEIDKWDLKYLMLNPHPDYTNCWWIIYGGVRLGLLTQEVVGEADQYGYKVEYTYVAAAIDSLHCFQSHDSVQAITELMLNGRL